MEKYDKTKDFPLSVVNEGMFTVYQPELYKTDFPRC